MTRPVVVVGAGGHCRPVLDAAFEAGFDVIGVIDLGYHGQDERILGCRVIGGPLLLQQEPPTRTALLAIGDNATRRDWFERLQTRGWTLPPLLHPRAVISRFCQVGEGAFVNAGAVLNAGVRIGDNSIVNTGALLDHESEVGPHSHIAPGARIAGRVTVGEQSFVGIGASVIQGIRIGEGAVVGAGSAIIRDVQAHTTVVGVPGRLVA